LNVSWFIIIKQKFDEKGPFAMKLPKIVDATFELKGRVALLTFNRDDVRNALTGTMLAEDIVNVVNWCSSSDHVSVLILTGAGSAFSSGGNVKEMQDKAGTFAGSPAAIQERYRRGIQQIPLAISRADFPVIAAVNGPAIGAGFDLACMCDLRIGSDKALLGETFINLGIIPGDGGAWFLQRLIGYQRAAELAFTGRLVKADEALSLGIFLEVVPQEDLVDRALALAAQIAAQPPNALRLTKRLMKLAQRTDLPDFLEISSAFQAVSHHTADHGEAVSAFLEKRKGKFTGE
jgi:enoyl-CoA hydratase/carnithine racemase